MEFNTKVSELIQKRYSCRTYKTTPLSGQDLNILKKAISANSIGPRSNNIRMKIISADGEHRSQLQGLGTYGFIKNPVGFILGSTREGEGSLEDFGYLLEILILKATELGIGTCWLGGTFTKSRFSKALGLIDGESIPSVISLGYPANNQAWLDRSARIYAGSDRRLPWDELFFTDSFSNPMSPGQSERYKAPLESVRLAPSASNKQPWRILYQDRRWHFYIRRTKNYPSPVFDLLLGLADLQKIDIGIAMAHFELSALEIGLKGKWIVEDPQVSDNIPGLEYNISWEINS